MFLGGVLIVATSYQSVPLHRCLDLDFRMSHVTRMNQSRSERNSNVNVNVVLSQGLKKVHNFEPCKRDDILQKRPIILRSLLLSQGLKEVHNFVTFLCHNVTLLNYLLNLVTVYGLVTFYV